MTLNVLTPTESLIETGVLKIVAGGEKGYFCLLPHHIDFVSTLLPGILSYEMMSGTILYLAIDEGVLVKKGGEVFISVRNAFKGYDLVGLRKVVNERYETIEAEEKKTREILAKLEGDITRLILETE